MMLQLPCASAGAVRAADRAGRELCQELRINGIPQVQRQMAVAVAAHGQAFEELLMQCQSGLAFVDDSPTEEAFIHNAFAAAQSLEREWWGHAEPCMQFVDDVAQRIHGLCDALGLPPREPIAGPTTPAASRAAAPEDEEVAHATVLVESPFCPDVRRLRERDLVFHPAVALYGPGHVAGPVLLGLYAPSILAEFGAHRGRIRRFTLAHVLRARLRWQDGAAIRHWAPRLDDTLYRRIINDVRLGFLAECHSPKVQAVCGLDWLHVWRRFLGREVIGAASEASAVDINKEAVVVTVLAALNAAAACDGSDDDNLAHYCADAEMLGLSETETRFGEWLLAEPSLHARFGEAAFPLRAWPVCLLRLAEDHVRDGLQGSTAMVAVDGPEELMAPELDERLLWRSAELRCGPVLPDVAAVFDRHRAALLAALPESAPPASPTTVGTAAEDSEPMVTDDEASYRRSLARRLVALTQDPLVRAPGHPLGDSGFRVDFLYPQ